MNKKNNKKIDQMKNSFLMNNILHTIFILLAVIIFALAGYSCKKYDSEPNRDRPCKVLFVTIITGYDEVAKKDVVLKNDTIRMEVMPGKYIAPLPVFPSYAFPSYGVYAFDAWYTDAPSSRTATGLTPYLPPYDLATKPIWLDVTLYSRWLKVSDL
jgi:hypothetical protein